MTHLDLFSGIGGFALAAERVWPDIEHTFCEIDPFCQTVLKKHWPKSKIYGDIRQLTPHAYHERQGGVSVERKQNEEVAESRSAGQVDLVTGGFPCQPFSHAGQRKGTDDKRHLWPEMCRVIREFSPRWVVGENVRGLLSIDGGVVFEQVCTDLEALGYEVQPFIIPACAVDAPHRRDRVWIVARHAEHHGCDGTKDTEGGIPRGNGNAEGEDKVCESPRSALSRDALADTRHDGSGSSERRGDDARPQNESTGRNQTLGDVADSQDGRSERLNARQGQIQSGRSAWEQDWPAVATRLCTLDDGLSRGLVRPRGWRNAAIKAAGNAIVPQVAEQIFNAIRQYEIIA